MAEIAIQYLRRSTAHQEDSLEQQLELNSKYIKKMGYLTPPEKYAAWKETGSGRSFNDRAVFQAMLKAVEAKIVSPDVLVMYRPSRFGRTNDLTEFGFYEHRFFRAGVRIEFSSGAEYNIPGLPGHLTRTLAYFQSAEYSNELSSNATRGMLENARNGFSTGGKPCLGYARMLVARDGQKVGMLEEGMVKGDDDTLKIVLVPDKPEVVEFVREQIFRRPYEMGWRAAKTARELNKLLKKGKGLPPSRAGRTMKKKDDRIITYPGTWKPSTIYDMWTNSTYIGWRTFNVEAKNEFHGTKILNKESHEPLIEEEVFWGIFERTKMRPWNERKMAPKRRRRPRRYPLSGLGHCIHCGEGISGSNTSNKRSGTHYYYKDNGATHGSCTAPGWGIPVKDFDEWVRQKIAGRLKSKHFQESLLGLLRSRLAPDNQPTERESIQSKLNEVNRAVESLLDLAINMPKQSGALAGRLADLEGQKEELEKKLTSDVMDNRPRVSDAYLVQVAEAITQKSEELLADNGEILAELAPRFIKEYRVDKIQRKIEVEFYDVPGFRPKMPKPLTCTDVVEGV